MFSITCKSMVTTLTALVFWAFTLPSAYAWDLVTGFFQTRNSANSATKVYETVTFPTAFPAGITPVVITMTDEAGSDSATIRIDDVTNSGFRATILEPAGYDGQHTSTWVSCVAMTPGSHRLPDGTRIDAGTMSTNKFLSTTDPAGSCSTSGSLGGCQIVSFGTSFASTPLFFSEIQTMNNEVAASIANEPYNANWPITCPLLFTSHLVVSDDQAEVALDMGDTSLTCIEAGGPTTTAGPIVAEAVGWIALAESSGSFDCSFDGSSPPANGQPFNTKALGRKSLDVESPTFVKI